MSNRIILRVGLTLLAGLGTIMFCRVSLSQAQPEAPADIVIHSPLWPKKLYGDPKLSHQKHTTEYNIKCVDCHHVYENGKNVWQEGQDVQKCESCHTCLKTARALKKATPEEKKLSLQKAFHDNCKGCHKGLAKKPGTTKSTAPVKCLECHPKKKPKK